MTDKLTIKMLCDIEGNIYERIKIFVAKNNEYDMLIKNINNKTQLENIIILKVFKRLKLVEKMCDEYIEATKPHNTDPYIYQNGIILNNTNLINILSPNKINYEILNYELIFFNPPEKMIYDEYKIKLEFDKFSQIIQEYIEDTFWIINHKDTLNFCVTNTVLSNTIKINNDVVNTHMNNMIKFIKRVYNVKTIKYKIVEDNKYDILWVLVSIKQ